MGIAEEMRNFMLSKIGKEKRFPTAAAMARFLGLKQTTATKLFAFLKGANTQYKPVLEWFEALGGQIALPDEELDDYLFVPMVEAVAGAGESHQVDGEIKRLYPFCRMFFEKERIPPKGCILMMTSGDSMEPLIREGDTILIDKTDTKPIDGRVYVVGLGDSLMVKRIKAMPQGLMLCSDNTERGNTPVMGDDLDTLRIYGRVRWIGRVM